VAVVGPRPRSGGLQQERLVAAVDAASFPHPRSIGGSIDQLRSLLGGRRTRPAGVAS
jgi:hypothetical protein